MPDRAKELASLAEPDDDRISALASLAEPEEASKSSIISGKTPRVTSGFNAVREGGRKHAALDYAFQMGDPLSVSRGGRVTKIGEDKRAGKHLFIDHGDGNVSSYSHLSQIDVQEGDEIEPGVIFGRAGSTGHSTGPHVHQVVRRGGARINPEETDIRPIRGERPFGRRPLAAPADDRAAELAALAEEDSTPATPPTAGPSAHPPVTNQSASNASPAAAAPTGQKPGSRPTSTSPGQWAQSPASEVDAQADSLIETAMKEAAPGKASPRARAFAESSLPADLEEHLPISDSDRVSRGDKPDTYRVVDERVEAARKRREQQAAVLRRRVERTRSEHTALVAQAQALDKARREEQAGTQLSMGGLRERDNTNIQEQADTSFGRLHTAEEQELRRQIRSKGELLAQDEQRLREAEAAANRAQGGHLGIARAEDERRARIEPEEIAKDRTFLEALPEEARKPTLGTRPGDVDFSDPAQLRDARLKHETDTERAQAEADKIASVPYMAQARTLLGNTLRGVGEIPAGLLDTIGTVAYELDKRYPLSTHPPKQRAEFFSIMLAEKLRGGLKGVLPADERLAGTFTFDTLPQAAGSALGFAGPGWVTKSKYLVPAFLGVTSGFSDGYNDAKRAGASDDDALKSALLNGGMGISEILPVSSWVGRMNHATHGLFGRALKEAAVEGAEEAIEHALAHNPGWRHVAKELALETLEEGGQEGAQQLVQNYGANTLIGYDQNRSTGEGVLASIAAGGLVGAGMSGGTHLLERGLSRVGRSGAPVDSAPAEFGQEIGQNSANQPPVDQNLIDSDSSDAAVNQSLTSDGAAQPVAQNLTSNEDANQATAAPETPRDQLGAVARGERAVTVVPNGEKIPPGLRSFKDFDGGRVVYNPEMVEREEVVAAMDAGDLDALNGARNDDSGAPANSNGGPQVLSAATKTGDSRNGQRAEGEGDSSGLVPQRGEPDGRAEAGTAGRVEDARRVEMVADGAAPLLHGSEAGGAEAASGDAGSLKTEEENNAGTGRDNLSLDRVVHHGGAGNLDSEAVRAAGVGGAEELAEPAHHSNYQPRDEAGTFVQGKPVIPTTPEEKTSLAKSLRERLESAGTVEEEEKPVDAPEAGDSYRDGKGRILEVRKADNREVVLGPRGGEGNATVTLSPKRFTKEFEKTKHKFSSTQVDVPAAEARAVRNLGASLIPDGALYIDPADDSYGREEHPHITVKYGLHTEQADDVRRTLEGVAPFDVTLGETSLFEAKNGTPYDVVKVGVESPELHALNAKLAQALKVTDTHPDYVPHVTLAYVKKGEGEKYAGDKSFAGKKLRFDSVTFSSSNGETVSIPLKGEKVQGEGKLAQKLKRAPVKRKANPEVHTLGQYVWGSGGMRADRDGTYRDALLRIAKLRPGIFSNSGLSVEQMATSAAESGYPVAGEGEYSVRGGVAANNVDPHLFLEMVEDDLRGIRKTYSPANEIAQQEVDNLSPEQQEELDDELRFLGDSRVVELLQEVKDGHEDEGDREELHILAGNYSVPDEAVESHLDYARESGAQLEGTSEARPEQGDTSFDFADEEVEPASTAPAKNSAPPRPAEQPSMLEPTGGLFGGPQESATQPTQHPADVERERLATRERERQSAQLHEAFGDDGTVVESLSKSDDKLVKAVASKLLDRAADLRANKKFDPKELTLPLKKLADLREQGVSVEEYERQGSMFGQELSPEQMVTMRAYSSGHAEARVTQLLAASVVDEPGGTLDATDAPSADEMRLAGRAAADDALGAEGGARAASKETGEVRVTPSYFEAKNGKSNWQVGDVGYLGGATPWAVTGIKDNGRKVEVAAPSGETKTVEWVALRPGPLRAVMTLGEGGRFYDPREPGNLYEIVTTQDVLDKDKAIEFGNRPVQLKNLTTGKEDSLIGPALVIPEEFASLYSEEFTGTREAMPGGDVGGSALMASFIPTPEEAAVLKRNIMRQLKSLLSGNTLASGLYPAHVVAKLLPDLTRLGAYHIKQGATTFKAFAGRMVDDLGDGITPHLRKIFAESKKLIDSEARPINDRPRSTTKARGQGMRADEAESADSNPVADGESRPESPTPSVTIIPSDDVTIPAVGMTVGEIKDAVQDHLENLYSKDELEVHDIAVIGSRIKGTAKEGSDLDVVVEYGSIEDFREDDVFNFVNDEENALHIEGIKVDINPVRPEKSGTLAEWLEQHGYVQGDSEAKKLIEGEHGRENPTDAAAHPRPVDDTTSVARSVVNEDGAAEQFAGTEDTARATGREDVADGGRRTRAASLRADRNVSGDAVDGRVPVDEPTEQGDSRDDANIGRSADNASQEARLKERSFPKTLEAAGLEGGTDRTYEVYTNKQALADADEILNEKGIDGAAEYLRSTDDWGPEHTALAYRLLAQTDGQRAVDVAATAARALTRQGQAIQAAQIVSRLAPERVAVVASRIADEAGVRLSSEKLDELKTLAAAAQKSDERARELQARVEESLKAVADADARTARIESELDRLRPQLHRALEAEERNTDLERKVANLQAQLRRVKDEKPRKVRTTAVGMHASALSKRLDRLEGEARARLAARKNGAGANFTVKGKDTSRRDGGSEAGASAIPLDLADWAIIGAAKLARNGLDFAGWSAEMLADLDEEIRPHLRLVYHRSLQTLQQERAEITRQRRERAGLRRAVEEGLDLDTVEADELARLIADAEEATSEHARRTQELARALSAVEPKGAGRRIFDAATDATNAPRSLMSSGDMPPVLRQGLLLSLMHPKAAASAFLRATAAGMRGKTYDDIVREIKAHPRFKEMRGAGLYLATIANERNEGLSDVRALAAREEQFSSRLVAKLPWVKFSERNFNAFADLMRAHAYTAFAEYLESHDLTAKADRKHFEAAASFVNVTSGRGTLGRMADQAFPFLSLFGFSPRFLVARVETPFIPLTYPPRVMAHSYWQLGKAGVALGVGMVLLSLVPGVSVQWWPPDGADWLKVKVGDYRWDLLGGMQQPFRFAYRVAANVTARQRGKKLTRGEEPGGIILNFLRTKTSPQASYVWDMVTGETMDFDDKTGKPEKFEWFGHLLDSEGRFNPGNGIAGRVLPMSPRDVYRSYLKDGLAGAAAASPSMIGAGFNNYHKAERVELSAPVQEEFEDAGKAAYSPKGTLKIAGQERTLTPDERSRIEGDVRRLTDERMREFLNPMTPAARRALDLYETGTDEYRKGVLKKAQSEAARDVREKFAREYENAHPEQIKNEREVERDNTDTQQRELIRRQVDRGELQPDEARIKLDNIEGNAKRRRLAPGHVPNALNIAGRERALSEPERAKLAQKVAEESARRTERLRQGALFQKADEPTRKRLLEAEARATSSSAFADYGKEWRRSNAAQLDRERDEVKKWADKRKERHGVITPEEARRAVERLRGNANAPR